MEEQIKRRRKLINPTNYTKIPAFQFFYQENKTLEHRPCQEKRFYQAKNSKTQFRKMAKCEFSESESEGKVSSEDETENETANEKGGPRNQEKLSDYERQRLKRIEENKRRMEALGLHKMANSFMGSVQKTPKKNNDKKGKRKMVDEDDEYNPTQDDQEMSSSEEEDENDEEFSLSKKKKVFLILVY